MTVGQRIKEARKAAGMTQKELADKLGIPFQGISQWERDLRTPKFETLKKISAVLGCDTLGLLFDSEEAFAGELEDSAQIMNDAFTYLSTHKGHKGAVEKAMGESKRYMLLSDIFRDLNSEGKKKVFEAIQQIASMKEYQKEDTDAE